MPHLLRPRQLSPHRMIRDSPLTLLVFSHD
jgi:hypothetical protein